MYSKKNIVLIAVLVLLVAASALLLYRSMSNQPLRIITPTVSTMDVIVQNQADQAKRRINAAMDKLREPNGALDVIMNMQQYQTLATTTIAIPDIGATGNQHPFSPITYSLVP